MNVGWLVGELVSTFTIDLHAKFDAPVTSCILVLLSGRHLNTYVLLAAPRRYVILDVSNNHNSSIFMVKVPRKRVRVATCGHLDPEMNVPQPFEVGRDSPVGIATRH